MTDDYIQDGTGAPKRVHAWVDENGKNTSREAAVAAIGKNEDGTWWCAKFHAAGLKPVQILTH